MCAIVVLRSVLLRSFQNKHHNKEKTARVAWLCGQTEQKTPTLEREAKKFPITTASNKRAGKRSHVYQVTRLVHFGPLPTLVWGSFCQINVNLHPAFAKGCEPGRPCGVLCCRRRGGGLPSGWPQPPSGPRPSFRADFDYTSFRATPPPDPHLGPVITSRSRDDSTSHECEHVRLLRWGSACLHFVGLHACMKTCSRARTNDEWRLFLLLFLGRAKATGRLLESCKCCHCCRGGPPPPTHPLISPIRTWDDNAWWDVCAAFTLSQRVLLSPKSKNLPIAASAASPDPNQAKSPTMSTRGFSCNSFFPSPSESKFQVFRFAAFVEEDMAKRGLLAGFERPQYYVITRVGDMRSQEDTWSIVFLQLRFRVCWHDLCGFCQLNWAPKHSLVEASCRGPLSDAQLNLALFQQHCDQSFSNDSTKLNWNSTSGKCAFVRLFHTEATVQVITVDICALLSVAFQRDVSSFVFITDKILASPGSFVSLCVIIYVFRPNEHCKKAARQSRAASWSLVALPGSSPQPALHCLLWTPFLFFTHCLRTHRSTVIRAFVSLSDHDCLCLLDLCEASVYSTLQESKQSKEKKAKILVKCWLTT